MPHHKMKMPMTTTTASVISETGKRARREPAQKTKVLDDPFAEIDKPAA